jgi:hypothetical protein
MRRREFIAFLGSSLAGWPLAAQQASPLIGFLNGASAEGYRLTSPRSAKARMTLVV